MSVSFDQLRYEKGGWRRIIDFIQLENSYCKIRLAEVIRHNQADPAFIDNAEFYQGYYIQQDIYLSIIKHDLNNFERQLEGDNVKVDFSILHIEEERNRFNAEIEKLVREFWEMRRSFNNFIKTNM